MREMENKSFIPPRLGSGENRKRTMWKKDFLIGFSLVNDKKENKIGKLTPTYSNKEKHS